MTLLLTHAAAFALGQITALVVMAFVRGAKGKRGGRR